VQNRQLKKIFEKPVLCDSSVTEAVIYCARKQEKQAGLQKNKKLLLKRRLKQ
jgi:hypothetical protein